jgi:hypothetical protein
MYKGVTKFRHMQGEAGAKASLFVPFLSFCVFKDTFKWLRLACSVMMQGNGRIKQGAEAGGTRNGGRRDGSLILEPS